MDVGAYFANLRPKRSAAASYDRELAGRLWDASAALVGVEWNPDPLPDDTKELS